jgi:hypothetical protein
MADYMEKIKEFQTGIVGVIGFAGVIITLVVNAWLARSARRDLLEDRLRALKVALTEELKVIKTAYVEGAKQLAEVPTNGSCAVPTARLNGLFNAHQSDLGLLPPKTLEKVLGAYLSHDQAATKLLILATPDSQLRGGKLLAIPAKHCGIAAKMYENMVAPVEEAIKALTA